MRDETGNEAPASLPNIGVTIFEVLNLILNKEDEQVLLSYSALNKKDCPTVFLYHYFYFYNFHHYPL